MKLYELTIQEAHELLRKKEISSQDLTQAILDRINAVDEAVGAYITVDGEMAMAQAKIADKEISKGNIRPLTGIPIALKDLICTKGLLTTCGSKILDNFIRGT
jgi:aspartyl-tRNA(Asn)/glutamyl-tRNA(Gln) amidotransferase subunit A